MQMVLVLMLCAVLVVLATAGAAQGQPAPAGARQSVKLNRHWTFNYLPAADADSAGCEKADFDDAAWPAAERLDAITLQQTIIATRHSRFISISPHWWGLRAGPDAQGSSPSRCPVAFHPAAGERSRRRPPARTSPPGPAEDS